jgi:hypothetical protein
MRMAANVRIVAIVGALCSLPNMAFAQVSRESPPESGMEGDVPPIPAPDFDPRSPPPTAPAPEEEPVPAPEEEPAPAPEEEPAPAPEEEPAPEAEPWHLLPQECRLQVHGWLSGGITFNGRRTSDRFNGPVTFNDRRSEGQMNQLYCVIERRLEAECGLDFGGRVDLLFGTDYIFTQSAGLETRGDFSPHWNTNRFYGLAMPQLFAEVGNQTASLKVGHFYTVIGYEVVPATGNFFYSHAYTMQYGEPFTHTGILGTWNASDQWTLTSGIVDGWDKFDPVTSRAAYIGGAAYTPESGQYSLAFALITGDEDGSAPPLEGNRTMYSLVFSWNPCERLQHVLQYDHGIQSLATGGTSEWYGLNQYLFYKLNDCWRVGLRGEWFRDDDGTRVTGLRAGNSTPGGHAGNFYQLTAGLNWSPTKNLMLRPECRWDGFGGTNAVAGPFDGRNGQFTAGVDLVLIW